MTVLLAQAVRLEGVSRSANCRWLQHYNHGVPNGTLSQDYEGASRANFPRTVDVNMQKTVALRPTL